MILHGIIRTRNGYKKLVEVAGYEGPDDLTPAAHIIRTQYVYARAILFLIPKEEPKR